MIVPILAQEPPTPDINGPWDCGDGCETDLSVTNGKVTGIGAKTSERDRRIFGFSNGRKELTGVWDGHKLRAKIRYHFELRFKERCPQNWEIWRDVTLEYSENIEEQPSGGLMVTQLLSGKWSKDTITPDCIILKGKLEDFTLRRFLLKQESLSPTSQPSVLKEPVSNEKPYRIRVDTAKPSAIVNVGVNLVIGLAGRKDSRARADRDYSISLSTSKGTVEPKQVKIPKGETSANAVLESDKPGDAVVSASTKQGLKSAEKSQTFCDSGPVTKFVLSENKQLVPADGKTPINLTIKFVNDDFVPVTGRQLKAVGIGYRGVGNIANAKAQSYDFTVPQDECSTQEMVTSDQPGNSTIEVAFRTQNEKREYAFFVPLSIFILLWASIGGLAGTFVRVFQHHVRSEKHSTAYYAVQFCTGVIAGVVVLLMSYFGLLSWEPTKFPSSRAFSFLMGVAGGYAGTVALDRLVLKVLSSSKNTNHPPSIFTNGTPGASGV
jgi:hypothetical protein